MGPLILHKTVVFIHKKSFHSVSECLLKQYLLYSITALLNLKSCTIIAQKMFNFSRICKSTIFVTKKYIYIQLICFIISQYLVENSTVSNYSVIYMLTTESILLRLFSRLYEFRVVYIVALHLYIANILTNFHNSAND